MAFSTWGFLFFYPQIYVVQSGPFCVLCGKSTPTGKKKYTSVADDKYQLWSNTYPQIGEIFRLCNSTPRAISLLFKSLLLLHNCQQKDLQLLSLVPIFCILKTRMNVILGLWWNNHFFPNLSQFLHVQAPPSWSHQKRRVFWRDQILRWQSWIYECFPCSEWILSTALSSTVFKIWNEFIGFFSQKIIGAQLKRIPLPTEWNFPPWLVEHA